MVLDVAGDDRDGQGGVTGVLQTAEVIGCGRDARYGTLLVKQMGKQGAHRCVRDKEHGEGVQCVLTSPESMARRWSASAFGGRGVP